MRKLVDKFFALRATEPVAHRPLNAGDADDIRNCFAGGGIMGALMRSKDWAVTPLGPVETWPSSLRTSISICLNSRFPVLLWWGDDLIKLYNDAYMQIIGKKHPFALGTPGRLVWPEIWDIIHPMLNQVIWTGEATWSDDLLLLLERHGYSEECYFTFSYSPIRDEVGKIVGVFTPVAETTGKVIHQRRLGTLHDLGKKGGESRTPEEAIRDAVSALAANSHDIPFSLIYLIDQHRDNAVLSGSAGVPDDSVIAPRRISLADADHSLWGEPLRHALEESSVSVTLEGCNAGDLPCGAWQMPPRQAMVMPILFSGTGERRGFLVAALSPHKQLDDAYVSFLELVTGQIATSLAGATQLEHERKRAESLAELDRAKTVFFSNISHEFRTPLTLMLSPIEEMLSQSLSLPGDVTDRLELIHRNSIRLLKLVNTLLDFSRIEAGRMQASFEPVDLAALTRDLASMFRSTVEHAGLKFTVDCPPLPFLVAVDKGMWEKIVMNLLSNAFKFTLDGEISVLLKDEGETVILEVRDTGYGIPSDELPHMFERFHTIKNPKSRSHEGSGIGLSMVQELVKLHDGEIAVESVVDIGTTMRVRIPVKRVHDQPYTPSGNTLEGVRPPANPFVMEASRWLSSNIPDTPGANGRQTGGEVDRHVGTVLVVDDNPDMLHYTAHLLAPHADVVCAANGKVAMELLRQRDIDLVLTDIMMPGMDGYALLKAIREKPDISTIPVILVSARAGEEATVAGLQAGADDYLVKPFTAHELVARVRTHITLARLHRETEKLLQRTNVDLETRVRERTKDLTRTLQELQTSEQRFSQLVELMPVAMYTCDAEGAITYFNRNAARLWGREPGSGTSADYFCGALKAFHPDGRPMPPADNPVAVALTTGSPERNHPVHIERPDGSIVIAEMNVDAIRDASGRVIGAICCLLDVTRPKELESALRESEERIRALMSFSPAVMFLKDTHGRYLEVNPQFETMFGIQRDDILGKTDEDVFPAVQARRFAANDETVIESGTPMEFEEDARYVDGTHSSIVSKFPIRDEFGNITGVGGIAVDITERKRAELQRDLLFDMSIDMMAIAGFDGYMKRCNPAMTRGLGFSHEELTAIPYLDLIHPEDLEKAREAVERLYRGDDIRSFECRMRSKSGEYRWTQWNVVAFAQEHLLLGVGRDVTEQRRIHEHMREREEFWHAVFDRSAVGIAYRRPDGYFVEANSSFCLMTGFSVDELRHLKDIELTHPDDRELNIRALEDLLSGRRGSFVIEKRYRTKSGSLIWVRSTVATIPNADGSNRFIIAVVENISDQKQATEALHRSQLVMTQAEELAHLGSWEWNLSANTVTWSEELYRIFGVSRDAFDGTYEAFIGYLHPDDRRVVSVTISQSLLTGRPFSVYERIVRPAGDVRTLISKGVVERDAEGRPVRMFGSCLDVTEFKLAEDQLRHTGEQLRALSARLQETREEERTRIAREIHDELGQVLTAINIDLAVVADILEEAPEHASRSQALARIRSVSSLVESSIHLIRKITTELRPDILDSLGLVHALQWLSRDFQERTGILVEFNVSDGGRTYPDAMATALFRIFQETLTNIARHSQATWAKVHLLDQDGSITLTVYDDGIGISDEQRMSSTSLGLVGMRERAMALGGEATIVRGDKGGTTVHVRIPGPGEWSGRPVRKNDNPKGGI